MDANFSVTCFVLLVTNGVTQESTVNILEALQNTVPTMSEYLRNTKNKINTYQINGLISQISNSDNEAMVASYAVDDYIFRNRKLNCPETPPDLVGPIGEITQEDYIRSAPNRVRGGEWKPQDCLPNHNVAIIIPYRRRRDHLGIVLSNLHPFLQRQQLHYKIYVVEQFGNLTFNKARLMNIAFTEALKDNDKWECFIFHDVDLIPEDDRNMYSCPRYPRHLSVAIKQFDYRLPYTLLVGGVFAIRTEHFFQVNGYSNIYWGWGGEDDDMGFRIHWAGLRITRPPANISRYHMINHQSRKRIKIDIRLKMLYNSRNTYKTDGLNSLSVLTYDVKWVREEASHTHIMVDIGKPPIGF